MTMASFILKNALRNKRRALLSVLSVAVSLFLLVTLLVALVCGLVNAFLVVVIGSSLALFAWRAPKVGLGGKFDTVSRESALLMNNMLLAVALISLLMIGGRERTLPAASQSRG